MFGTRAVVVETLNDFLRTEGAGARVLGGMGLSALGVRSVTVFRARSGFVEIDVDAEGKRNPG